jgi:hypothetical protein
MLEGYSVSGVIDHGLTFDIQTGIEQHRASS